MINDNTMIIGNPFIIYPFQLRFGRNPLK